MSPADGSQVCDVTPHCRPIEQEEEDDHFRCCDCRFYENSKCKRFPPVFTGASDLDTASRIPIVDYPETGSKDWCGEFKPSNNKSKEAGDDA